MTETLAYWYSSDKTQRDLSDKYQHERVKKFKEYFAVLCHGHFHFGTEGVKRSYDQLVRGGCLRNLCWRFCGGGMCRDDGLMRAYV